jgi:hypothetical protein
MFINVHLHQALSATADQFCASDQSNERGQMADDAGMFSRQIPAYAGLTSGQILRVHPGGGMIAVGIDLYIRVDIKLADFEGTRFCSEISHTRTDLTA